MCVWAGHGSRLLVDWDPGRVASTEIVCFFVFVFVLFCRSERFAIRGVVCLFVEGGMYIHT